LLNICGCSVSSNLSFFLSQFLGKVILIKEPDKETHHHCDYTEYNNQKNNSWLVVSFNWVQIFATGRPYKLTIVVNSDVAALQERLPKDYVVLCGIVDNNKVDKAIFIGISKESLIHIK
jgi:hypothetical protein